MCVLRFFHEEPSPAAHFPKSVHRCGHSSILLKIMQPKAHPYFQSFLMDMFFSLSFCITWARRRHLVPRTQPPFPCKAT